MAYGYDELEYRPLRGRALSETEKFLAEQGLSWEQDVTYTVLLRDGEGRIAATASLQEDVIKCVAVDSAVQGEGLTAALLTDVRREALSRGRRHLFLYTKPENRAQFAGLGFHEIAGTETALLMEDKRTGFTGWVESVRRPEAAGTIGAAVMNCDPMTVGHRYLIEQAAAQCDFLYLFVVSEDKSAVPALDRLAMVQEAARDLPGVSVTGTDRYLISYATFPDYFLKDRNCVGEVWTALDIAVFCRVAKALGVTKRFVGSEPFCPVTGAYNRAMAELLPGWGIELVEVPRLEREGAAISATAVRKLLRENRWQEIRPLVPEAVFTYFAQEQNRLRIRGRLEQGEAAPQ